MDLIHDMCFIHDKSASFLIFFVAVNSARKDELLLFHLQIFFRYINKNGGAIGSGFWPQIKLGKSAIKPVVDIIWSMDMIWAISENHRFRIRFET